MSSAASLDLPHALSREDASRQQQRTLFLALAIAFCGSLIGEKSVLAGEIHGAECRVIAIGILVEASAAILLSILRRKRLEIFSLGLVICFGLYLTAGVITSLSCGRPIDLFVYLFWFFPLLVFNRMLNDTMLMRSLEVALRVLPPLLLAVLFPIVLQALNPVWVGLIPVFILSYVLFGVMLKSVTRFREDYVGSLARTALLEAEKKAFDWASSQDPLTGLPNREEFKLCVRAAVGDAHTGVRYGTVILIHITGLRSLNHSLGHFAGDELLIRIGRQIRECVPAGYPVARWDSATFAILASGLSADLEMRRNSVQQLLNSILRQLERESFDGGRGTRPILRVGVAEFADLDCAADQLLQRAEIALSEAQSRKITESLFFSDYMLINLRGRISLELELHSALAKKQFTLVYQPQVSREGSVIGAEALLRWQHPEIGVVSPSVFIPLAEETDLIVTIGKWVVEEACRQAAKWAHDPELENLVVSINISARQLLDPNFVPMIRSAIERSGARPEQIRLELTESSMITDLEGTIAKMLQLRETGLTFALDDFGTGYSCLNQLQRLPLDAIKIDRGFVADLCSNEKSSHIVQAITVLAHALRISLVAEGMETLEQFEILNGLGCDTYQGYFHSHPLPAWSLEMFVKQRKVAVRKINASVSTADSIRDARPL